MELEVDRAVGVHRAEALVDAPQFQERRGFHYRRRSGLWPRPGLKQRRGFVTDIEAGSGDDPVAPQCGPVNFSLTIGP
jgi:hypothetical protein